jgi:hypothetical protein
MLGIRLGYYSEDPKTAFFIDSIVDFAEDLQPKFVEYFFPMFSGEPFTEEGGVNWLNDFWGKIIPVVEARLVGHGAKFIAGGNSPTIADFKVFQTLMGSLYNANCPAPRTLLDQL